MVKLIKYFGIVPPAYIYCIHCFHYVGDDYGIMVRVKLMNYY